MSLGKRWKLLANITKSSILSAAGVLDAKKDQFRYIVLN